MPRPKNIIESAAPPEGEGSWILSYGDMMSLLLCFFIVIASISTVNQQALEEVSSSMAKGIKKKHTKPLKAVVDDIKKIVKEENLEKDMSVDIGPQGAEIKFAGQSLFESAEAEINKSAYSILKKVSTVLQKEDARGYYVIVEGHTDNVPIQSEIFPSNWELSSARASSVIRYFNETGIKPSRCKAIGYADTRPEAPNADATGNSLPLNQSKNRRVIIKLTKNLLE